ncbi:MAG: hypothetical protein RBR74_06695, partial [Ignavibacteriaceae bacterium]|nr:hypothetical protein [Ignavibacteriaceae bacterium]
LDEEALLYSVEVMHVLAELRKRNLFDTRTENGLGTGWEQLLDHMLTESDEITIGSLSYDLIAVKDLINMIVSETETETLFLDWTNVDLYTQETFEWSCIKAGETSGERYNTPTSDIDDCYMMPQQVICMGQNAIYSPNEYTDSMKADSPSLFELLSLFCSIYALYFIPKDATTFYVVSEKEVATGYFDDDEIYDIETEIELTESWGTKSSYSTLDHKLWFVSSVSSYDSGTAYYNGDYVAYEGNIYRATFGYYNAPDPETGSIVGIAPSDPDYWMQVTLDVEMTAYIDPIQTTEWFVSYEYSLGVKPTSLDWYDNFNIIVMDGTVGYVSIAAADSELTPLYYQRRSKLLSYKRTTIITDASKVFSATLKDYDLVSVSDINNDIIEVEYCE